MTAFVLKRKHCKGKTLKRLDAAKTAKARNVIVEKGEFIKQYKYIQPYNYVYCRWTYNTPPDSPRGAQYKEVVYEVDIYAIPSIEGNINFL